MRIRKVYSQTMKYVNELKGSMPKSENINENKLQNKLEKIVTKKTENKIDDIIFKEREGVKKYISTIRDKKPLKLPPRVSNVVYSYLAEKINDN